MREVRDRTTDRTYAKMTYRIREGADVEKARERAQKEIEFMESLKSDSLTYRVRFVDFQDTTARQDGGFEILMEPVAKSGSLKDFIDRCDVNGLPPKDFEMVSICFQLLSGLCWIHKKAVRHRDIKPENILLHRGGAIFTDFGISLEFAATPSSTPSVT